LFDTSAAEMRLTRPRNIELDDVLGLPIRVLDHGFVRLIDYLGDDNAIVQAARVSYGAGTKKAQEDYDLIRYLLRHGHTSPFEQVEVKFHLKMPLFVARQLVRTRTAMLNEESARYSLVGEDQYLPGEDRIRRQSKDNKQGSGDLIEPAAARDMIRNSIEQAQHQARAVYLDLVEEDDLARELARITLPLSTYTQFYWKINLHNLFRVLSQRLHPHAQWEIRQYAEAMAHVAHILAPRAYGAFVDYQRDAATLSRTERAVLHEVLAGADLERTARGFGLRGRELREFLAKVA
jgi:thymidylate synthase (FAD)